MQLTKIMKWNCELWRLSCTSTFKCGHLNILVPPQQFSSISLCSSASVAKSALWQQRHDQEALKMPLLRARLLFGPVSNYLFEFPPGAGVAVLGPVISVSGKALSCAWYFGRGIRRNKLVLVLFVCVVWGLWDFLGFFKESTPVNKMKAQITIIGNREWSRHEALCDQCCFISQIP